MAPNQASHIEDAVKAGEELVQEGEGFTRLDNLRELGEAADVRKEHRDAAQVQWGGGEARCNAIHTGVTPGTPACIAPAYLSCHSASDVSPARLELPEASWAACVTPSRREPPKRLRPASLQTGEPTS